MEQIYRDSEAQILDYENDTHYTQDTWWCPLHFFENRQVPVIPSKLFQFSVIALPSCF